MLNINELYDLIPHTADNYPALSRLHESFMDDFRKYHKELAFNKSTRAAMLKNLQGHNLRKAEELETVYITDCMVVMLKNNVDIDAPVIKVMDIIKPFLTGRRPVDYYAVDAIAMARALGWTPRADKQAYYIEIEGNYYDFNYVYQALTLAVGKRDEYIRVELTSDTLRPSVWFTGSAGSVMILPYIKGAGGVNVNYTYNMDVWQGIEKTCIEDMKKTA